VRRGDKDATEQAPDTSAFWYTSREFHGSRAAIGGPVDTPERRAFRQLISVSNGRPAMRPAFALVAALAFSSPDLAHAQSKAQCRTIVKNANSMIAPSIVNARRVEEMGRHVSAAREATSGELRTSLDRFDEARRDLVVALQEFIKASRELLYKFETCD
jgi:hypothetical protein